MYGQASPLINRQALHCQYVSFYSPFINQVIEVSVPIPADMRNLIQKNEAGRNF